ncbi:glycosyltransferase [Halanaerobium hydrogeniformans]|uniref:glycosyltransferase n=1 Tax=Halanaerobium hydrogeniformans TaxID=656519 RepID=UPI0002F6D84A|nr:glycosyltransferase [Halanaerobium hydrogeniformans]
MNAGGAQRVIINLLKALDKSKFKIKLVLLDYDENQAYLDLIPKEVEIININRRGRYSIIKIKNIIKKEEPDICFATLPQVCKAVMIGHKLSGSNSKVIFRESNYRPKNKMFFLNYILLKLVYSYSDYNIALTEDLKKQIKKQYNISDNKITTIYNPLNIELIQKKIKDSSCSFEQNNFNIVSCGRLSKQKNFSMLIKSIKLIREENINNIVLYILGDGPLKKHLEGLIWKYDLTNSVYLLGYKKNPFKYIANADLFILSSLYEGMPNVILESLACGTPILSTNCPTGPKEILEEDKYGWLVPNDNVEAMSRKIIHLYNNPEEINKKQKKLDLRAERFSINNIVKEYENLFFKVLDK